MKRKTINISSVKNVNLSKGLSLALIGGLLPLTYSCRSTESAEEADYEVSETYSQGVKTFIKETEAGKFTITDEIAVPADSSMAVITYLDGRVENLSKEQSKTMIDKEIQQNPNTMGQGFGLGNVLLYGGMGYLLARSFGGGYNRYRPEYRREDNRSATGTTNTGSKYYANKETFEKSSNVQESVNKSRTVTRTPVKSRSGFFGRSSRGGGFGG